MIISQSAARARFQNVRVRRMTDDAAHVEINRDLVHQVRVFVDDRDFVLFTRKPAGNALPYAPGAADQNVHQFSLSALVSYRAARLLLCPKPLIFGGGPSVPYR
jgi:hypothetical protein